MDPRLERLDDAVAEMEAVERGNLIGDRLPLIRSSIVSSTGSSRVRPGQTVTLRARIPGQAVTKVEWSVTTGPQGLLRGARADGSSLQLNVPKTLAGATGVILARATLKNGDTVDASTLVRVQGTSAAVRTRASDDRLLAEAALVRSRAAATARAASALLDAKLGGRAAGRAGARREGGEGVSPRAVRRHPEFPRHRGRIDRREVRDRRGAVIRPADVHGHG
jgi:hypothetical protein